MPKLDVEVSQIELTTNKCESINLTEDIHNDEEYPTVNAVKETINELQEIINNNDDEVKTLLENIKDKIDKLNKIESCGKLKDFTNASNTSYKIGNLVVGRFFMGTGQYMNKSRTYEILTDLPPIIGSKDNPDASANANGILFWGSDSYINPFTVKNGTLYYTCNQTTGKYGIDVEFTYIAEPDEE